MDTPNIYVNGDGTGNNGLATAALMNGGMNNWMNNPFAYLMFLPFMYGMTGNGWGNNNGNNAVDALSNQIQSLAGQVSDNHNSDLTMQSVNAVGASVKDNGIALNAGIDTVNAGLCGVKSAILEQGSANQLANCQQTNTILMGNQALQNVVQNGFTSLGYQLQSGLCDAKQTSTNNTQRIIDTLTNKWSTDSAATITQLRDELATERQTTALIAALGGTTYSAKTTSTAS